MTPSASAGATIGVCSVFLLTIDFRKTQCASEREPIKNQDHQSGDDGRALAAALDTCEQWRQADRTYRAAWERGMRGHREAGTGPYSRSRAERGRYSSAARERAAAHARPIPVR